VRTSFTTLRHARRRTPAPAADTRQLTARRPR
jgi:hypothetical protein